MEGLFVGTERGKTGSQKPDEATGGTGIISKGEYLAADA